LHLSAFILGFVDARTQSRLVFLDRCDLRVTAFRELVCYDHARHHRGASAAMIANVVNRLREWGRNDRRVLSLRTAEWLMLIIGGLAGSLILMLR
jgi:hypothetical protein